jgi:hypothetical protein
VVAAGAEVVVQMGVEVVTEVPLLSVFLQKKYQ